MYINELVYSVNTVCKLLIYMGFWSEGLRVERRQKERFLSRGWVRTAERKELLINQ